MFQRYPIGAIMMMVASLGLASSMDAHADEVGSVFATHFVREYPVLSGTGEARLAAQAAKASVPSIRILMLRGGKADISAAQRTLPVVRKVRQALVGVAEDRKGRRVHFKVVRGGLVPAHERETATYPHDMAFCMTDEEGRSLFQLTVGDSMGDSIPECGASGDADSIESRAAAFDNLPSVPQQARYTMAAVKTMGALAKLDFSDKFAEEHRLFAEQRAFLRKAHKPNEEIVASDNVIILDEDGRAVPSGMTLAEADLELALRASSSDLATPQVMWFRGRRHAVQAHAAWIHGLASLAEHSATYTARYEDQPAPFGSYYDIRVNCNHGRCPNQMFMKYLILTEPRGHTHVHNWYCVTAYNGFSFTGTHNCNDDTVCETRSVRFDRHWSELFGTPCSDPYIRRYAPGPWE